MEKLKVEFEQSQVSIQGSLVKPFEIPPQPAPKACPSTCGNRIHPNFVEPAYFQERLMMGTGIWIFEEFCSPCTKKRIAERDAKQKTEKLVSLTDNMGLDEMHKKMTYETMLPHLRPYISLIDGYRHGLYNLFLWGKCGPGKTHAGVCLLRDYVTKNLVPGRLVIVPELLDELRSASREHKAEGIVNEISGLGALLLDELAVERPTAFAQERLYMIIDRWWRREKKGLIITSNRDLDWISENVDDRISSRISGMCQVVEIKGPDCRIGAQQPLQMGMTK